MRGFAKAQKSYYQYEIQISTKTFLLGERVQAQEHMGLVKQNRVFNQSQNVQTRIILHMP